MQSSETIKRLLKTKVVSPASDEYLRDVFEERLRQIILRVFPTFSFRQLIEPKKTGEIVSDFVKFAGQVDLKHTSIAQIGRGTNLVIHFLRKYPSFIKGTLGADIFVGRASEDGCILGIRAEWMAKALFLIPKTKIVALILPKAFNLNFFKDILDTSFIYKFRKCEETIFLNIYK